MTQDISEKENTKKAEFLIAQHELEKQGIKRKLDYYSFLQGYNKALSWFRSGKEIK